MTALTYKEAYVLGILANPPDSLEDCVDMLAGLYVGDILDTLPSSWGQKERDLVFETYCNPQGALWTVPNLLWQTLQTLEERGEIHLKEIDFFDPFAAFVTSLPDFLLEKHSFFSLTNDQEEWKGDLFKKLLTCLKGDKTGNTQYEIRFFVPGTPRIGFFALLPLFSDKKAYKIIESEETYLFHEEGHNLKIEEGKLYLKRSIADIIPIDQFTKKQKVPIPINLAAYPQTSLLKKRYVLKNKHLKMDFSTLWVNKIQWTSVCIESSSLKKVMALSLLLNQGGMEKQSYVSFLKGSSLGNVSGMKRVTKKDSSKQMGMLNKAKRY